MELRQSGGNPNVPDAGERVWGVFWALDGRRQSNGYGANAISHQEIAACADLRGVRLHPWEVRALDAMERARLLWLNTPEEQRVYAIPASLDMIKSVGRG